MNSLATKPKQLLKINSFQSCYITCAAISYNGDFVSFATSTSTILYRIKSNLLNTPKVHIQEKNIEIKAKAMKDLPPNFQAASKMLFMNHSNHLIMVDKNTQEIRIFVLMPSTEGQGYVVDFVDIINTVKRRKVGIKLLSLSEDDQFLSAVTIDSSVHVWKVGTQGDCQYISHLPNYIAPVTAISITTMCKVYLVVAYSDGKIIEYNVTDMQFTCSDFDNYLKESKSRAITSITLDKRNSDVYIMLNGVYLFTLKKFYKTAEIQQFHKIQNLSLVYMQHLQVIL